MKSIRICMGSACHLKDAQVIVEVFQQQIRAHGLEDKLVLKGSFCLGHCNEAVPILFEERLIKNVSPQNAVHIFETEILPALEGD